MIYLSAVLLITICSLLHDGDYVPKWVAMALHGVLLAIALHGYGYWALLASVTSVGLFWGVFRRGWMAKAELTAIRLKDEPSINAIVKAYPLYLGYVPKYITIGILYLPFEPHYRRIQSGLIALLWTGHLSALPVLGVLWLSH